MFELISVSLENSNTYKQGGWKINEDTIEQAHSLMIEDFRKGRIPFYEQDFNTGNIIQKFSGNKELIVLQANPVQVQIQVQNPVRVQIQVLNRRLSDIIENNKVVLDKWLKQ